MLLTSDRILPKYHPTKAIRVYVDDGPARVAAIAAQIHKFEKVNKPVWRPAANTNYAKKCFRNELYKGAGKVSCCTYRHS